MKYEQIVINTVDDLPKDKGIYIAKRKTKDYVSTHLYKGEDYNELWYRTIDWYLVPIAELKEEEATHQVTPQGAEEILEDNMNKSLWTFISTYPVAYKSDIMLKEWIIDAMEEYRQQGMPTEEEIKEWIKKEMPINVDDDMDEEVNKLCRKSVRLFGEWMLNKWKGQ